MANATEGPNRGRYRYQLRSLTSLARYVPVYVGLILCTAFTSSVLYDSSDTGFAAFQAGSGLLGLFGGFCAVVLPAVMLATAVLRRGRPFDVRSLQLHPDRISLRIAGLRRPRSVDIEAEHIRSVHSHPIAGRRRVSIELTGGLGDGDRVELDLEPSDATELVRLHGSGAPRFLLARKSYGPAVAVWAAATLLGAWVTQGLLSSIQAAVEAYPQPLYVQDGGAGAAKLLLGWTLGLGVTAIGVFGALGNLLLSPPRLTIGLDGVRIDGLLRRRFLPLTEIVRVERAWYGLRLVTTRQVVRVVAFGASPDTLDACASTLEHNARSAAKGAQLPALDRRAPASLARWRAAILGKVDVASYREPNLSRQDLEQTLSGCGVAPELRVAAALALSEGDERSARERIRVTASCLADERTRTLLERLAEEEADEELLSTRLSQLARSR